MIYSSEIGISIIGTPLTWTLPKDYKFYDGFLDYPNLLFQNHYMQILISTDLYNENSTLYVKMKDCSGKILSVFTLEKKYISTDVHYADTNIIIGTIRGNVYFEIYNDNTLLADSLIYNLDTSYTDLHKTIFYTHKKNKYNTIFKNSITSEVNTFKLGIPCGFKGDSIEMKDTANDYQLSNNTNKRVSSNPYPIEKLVFGYGVGIPQYIYEKLAYIFACSEIWINRIQYTVANGEKLEKEDVDENGLGIYSILVQRNNNYLENDFYTGKVFMDEFNENFS